jgi:hypothetical protein
MTNYKKIEIFNVSKKRYLHPRLLPLSNSAKESTVPEYLSGTFNSGV